MKGLKARGLGQMDSLCTGMAEGGGFSTYRYQNESCASAAANWSACNPCGMVKESQFFLWHMASATGKQN